MIRLLEEYLPNFYLANKLSNTILSPSKTCYENINFLFTLTFNLRTKTKTSGIIEPKLSAFAAVTRALNAIFINFLHLMAHAHFKAVPQDSPKQALRDTGVRVNFSRGIKLRVVVGIFS